MDADELELYAGQIFEDAKTLALAAVLSDDDWRYYYRSICRWYSAKFSTTLHKVFDLPMEFVLQNFFESTFEDKDAPVLLDEARYYALDAVGRAKYNAEQARDLDQSEHLRKMVADVAKETASLADKAAGTGLDLQTVLAALQKGPPTKTDAPGQATGPTPGGVTTGPTTVAKNEPGTLFDPNLPPPATFPGKSVQFMSEAEMAQLLEGSNFDPFKPSEE